MPTVFPEPPIERSIFGWDPKDEFAGIVADWIWNVVGAAGGGAGGKPSGGRSWDNLEVSFVGDAIINAPYSDARS